MDEPVPDSVPDTLEARVNVEPVFIVNVCMSEALVRNKGPVAAPPRARPTVKFPGEDVAACVSMFDHVLVVLKAKDCTSTLLVRNTTALGAGGGAEVTVTFSFALVVAPVALAVIFACPAPTPSTASIADPGIDPVETGSVTVCVVAPGAGPTFATEGVSDVKVTVSGEVSGMSVVTFIDAELPA
jgi:hypothetical protein